MKRIIVPIISYSVAIVSWFCMFVTAIVYTSSSGGLPTVQYYFPYDYLTIEPSSWAITLYSIILNIVFIISIVIFIAGTSGFLQALEIIKPKKFKLKLFKNLIMGAMLLFSAVLLVANYLLKNSLNQQLAGTILEGVSSYSVGVSAFITLGISFVGLVLTIIFSLLKFDITPEKQIESKKETIEEPKK